MVGVQDVEQKVILKQCQEIQGKRSSNVINATSNSEWMPSSCFLLQLEYNRWQEESCANMLMVNWYSSTFDIINKLDMGKRTTKRLIQNVSRFIVYRKSEPLSYPFTTNLQPHNNQQQYLTIFTQFICISEVAVDAFSSCISCIID